MVIESTKITAGMSLGLSHTLWWILKWFLCCVWQLYSSVLLPGYAFLVFEIPTPCSALWVVHDGRSR